MIEVPRDDIVKFLVDGKFVSEEEAVAASPLDEESQERWSQLLQNTKEVKDLETRIAQRIDFLSREGLDENGNILISLETRGDWVMDHRFWAAKWVILATGNLLDMVDPENKESYGNIYAGSDYGIIAPEYPEWLNKDPNKLWESATLKQFNENGKYNQLSLSDDGTFYLTIIKPGAVESIKYFIWENIDPYYCTRIVSEIREYLYQNWELKWTSGWEGYRNNYNKHGGIYSFDRYATLLDSDEYEIIISWLGKHTEPLVEGGPFSIDDVLEVHIEEK